MSTLTMARQRTPHHDALDGRFAALVHHARRSEPSPVAFDEVFDLDYGQPALDQCVAPVEPTTAPAQPVARRVRVRLTRRGRVVLTLAFLAAAIALMVPLGGLATATLTGGNPEPVRIVEVGPGETLYGIADDLAAPGEIREMVHRIQELNSLPGGQITEGQKLAVPRG